MFEPLRELHCLTPRAETALYNAQLRFRRTQRDIRRRHIRRERDLRSVEVFAELLQVRLGRFERLKLLPKQIHLLTHIKRGLVALARGDDIRDATLCLRSTPRLIRHQ